MSASANDDATPRRTQAPAHAPTQTPTQTQTQTQLQSGGGGTLRCAALLPAADGGVRLLDDVVLRWHAGRFTAITAPDATAPAPSGLLALPGFCDLHIHWPQSHVRGRFGGALLPWLREHIWPAEAAFADEAHADALAAAFVADVVRAGTCAAMTFGPPFLRATEALLRRAPRGFFDGPALMERNSPQAMSAPAVDVLDAMAAAEPAVRARLVVSPRFAPTMTTTGLAAAGARARREGWPVQSHLSENVDEVAWVGALFPDATDYTDVYDRGDLLGPHSVFAHGVHLSDRELARLAVTDTLIAHCPTSNEALASGRMPVERLEAAGVRWVLATDVGAGPELSLLHVIDRFVAIHEAAGVPVDAGEALSRATSLPGAFLAQFDGALDGLGQIAVGAPAHLVAFEAPALPARADLARADATVRALLARHRGAFERAPARVVLWGMAIDD